MSSLVFSFESSGENTAVPTIYVYIYIYIWNRGQWVANIFTSNGIYFKHDLPAWISWRFRAVHLDIFQKGRHNMTTQLKFLGSSPTSFPWISNSDPVGSNSNHNRNQKLSISTPPNKKPPVPLFLPPTNHFCWTFSPKKSQQHQVPSSV